MGKAGAVAGKPAVKRGSRVGAVKRGSKLGVVDVLWISTVKGKALSSSVRLGRWNLIFQPFSDVQDNVRILFGVPRTSEDKSVWEEEL